MLVLRLFAVASLAIASSWAASETFVAPAEFSTGVVPDALVTHGNSLRVIAPGDFNGDGKQDILTVGKCGTGEAVQAAVALGNGDGTFQNPVITAVGSATGSTSAIAILGLGDFNSDGKLDVLLAVAAIAPMTVQVFLGNGQGGFAAGTVLPITDAAVVTGSFIAAGKLDVAAVTPTGVSLYAGVGDGTFFPPIVTPVSEPKYLAPFIAAADTNRDGLLDIIAEFQVGDGTSVLSLFGDGAGSFVAGPSTAGQAYEQNALGMTVADFDRDGNPDLADFLIGPLGQTCIVRIFLGRNDGSFSAPASYPFVPPPARTNPAVVPIGIAAATSQVDGVPSLFLMQRDAPLYELPNTGHGIFGNAFPVVTGPATGIANADINGDGVPDIVTANVIDNSEDITGSPTLGSGESGTVLIAKGDGSWLQPAAYADPTPTHDFSGIFPFVQHPAVFADFNNDGHLDVLLPMGTLMLGATGTAAPQFQPGFTVATTESGSGGTSGDFNSDGQLDFILPSFINGGQAIEVGLGNGDGTFRTHAEAAPAGTYSPHSFATGDLDQDGHLDLVELAESQNVIVWLGIGDGTFRAPVVYPIGRGLGNPAETDDGIALAVAGLERTGRLDVVVVGFSGIAIFAGNGDGTLSPPQFIDPPAGAMLSLTAADVNRDGNSDLVIGYISNSDPKAGVTVLLGNGDRTFQPGQPLDVVPAATSTLFTDVNHDGYSDVLGCGLNGDLGVAFGGPDGFSTPEQYSIGAFCYQVYAGPLANGEQGIAALTGALLNWAWEFIPMMLPASDPPSPLLRRPALLNFRRLHRN